jgi:hypothetical protein
MFTDDASPLSLIVEGAAKKVSQFKMPLESNCNKNFNFDEQKCIFERH